MYLAARSSLRLELTVTPDKYSNSDFVTESPASLLISLAVALTGVLFKLSPVAFTVPDTLSNPAETVINVGSPLWPILASFITILPVLKASALTSPVVVILLVILITPNAGPSIEPAVSLPTVAILACPASGTYVALASFVVIRASIWSWILLPTPLTNCNSALLVVNPSNLLISLADAVTAEPLSCKEEVLIVPSTITLLPEIVTSSGTELLPILLSVISNPVVLNLDPITVEPVILPVVLITIAPPIEPLVNAPTVTILDDPALGA